MSIVEDPEDELVLGAAREWLTCNAQDEGEDTHIDDLAQEVVVAFIEERLANNEIINVKAWAQEVSKRKLWAFRQSESKRNQAGAEAGAIADRAWHEELYEAVNTNDAVKVLHLCLKRNKNEVQNRILDLTFIKEKTSPEIAEILGLTPDNVRTIRGRVLKSLNADFKAAGMRRYPFGIEIGLAASLCLKESGVPDVTSTTDQSVAMFDRVTGWIKGLISRFVLPNSGEKNPARERTIRPVQAAVAITCNAFRKRKGQ